MNFFADSKAAATCVADFWDQAADEIPVQHGSRRLSELKKMAVYWAHHLLKNFGAGVPGMTRDGRWHKLAGVLHGNEVSFDYLRHAKSHFAAANGAVTA